MSNSTNNSGNPIDVQDQAESKASLKVPGKSVRMVLFLLLVVGLLAALGFWRLNAGRESTDDAQIEGNIVPVSARVGGTVKIVKVSDNQLVEPNAALVDLDPTDFQVAVRRAEAELQDAEANAQAQATNVPLTELTSSSQLAAAQAGVAAARKAAEAAAAREAEARAQHDRTAADLARFQKLVEKDEISRQQLDAAVAAEASSRAALDSAGAALAAARSQVTQAQAQERAAGAAPQQVGISRARASAAEALREKNQAALEQAKLNLGYTEVRAPAAGIVSKKAVQPGQVIGAGQPLLAIVPLDEIWVVANFKETQLKDMRPGQKVSIYVDAFRKTFTGRVDSIGGATAAKFSLLPPENATGNFVKVVQRVPVKIVFDPGQDPEHRLRPGLSVVPTVTAE